MRRTYEHAAAAVLRAERRNRLHPGARSRRDFSRTKRRLRALLRELVAEHPKLRVMAQGFMGLVGCSIARRVSS